MGRESPRKGKEILDIWEEEAYTSGKSGIPTIDIGTTDEIRGFQPIAQALDIKPSKFNC